MKNLVFIIILIVALPSCAYFKTKIDQKDSIARVHETFLYLSDLKGLVPDGISVEDSTLLVKNFIDNWIRQTLLLHKAEKNISVDQNNINKQLESYRKSLIIFAYEEEIIKQKLDTLVSIDEIKEYYESNSANFELKRNIMKFDFIKLNKLSPKIEKVKKWFNENGDNFKQKLESYCHQYAVRYSLNDTAWYYFEDVLKDIPMQPYDQERFLKYNTSIEMEDSLHLYFVRIKNFRIKDSSSPLELEKVKIKNIIINQRKLKLLNRVEKMVYDEAVKNGEFEII